MDDREIHACIDRVLPKDMVVEAGERALDENPTNAPIFPFPTAPGFGGPSPLEMAVLAAKKWRNGRTLKVSFLDGDPAVKEKVANVAQRWKPHANITFQFGSAADSDIRISFKQRGSWSYLGTDALTIDKRQPTMNYGWLTTESEDSEYERVVVHEFGHALGAIHEHQNPAASIPWDKEAVYRYYEGPPNNWTRAQVDNNLFRRYAADQTQFSAFDPKSIMLYPVPNQFTIGDFEVGMNTTLSEADKAFIATLYPGRPKDESELQLDGPAVKASIGAHGEEDPFRFTLADRRDVVIETSGSTDVVMGLFGPGSDTVLVAADDDSGQGRNARLARRLAPGAYLVRVRHFNPRATGDYGLSVRSG